MDSGLRDLDCFCVFFFQNCLITNRQMLHTRPHSTEEKEVEIGVTVLLALEASIGFSEL